MPIPSALTLLEVKKSVARSANGQNDVDQQDIAGEHIRDVIQDFNNVRDWTWQQNTVNYTNVSSANITNPSRMKKVYSLITSVRPLTYINRRERERNTVAPLGGAYFYEVFNNNTTGSIITVYDNFTSAAPEPTVTLNYLQMMDYPANNSSTFSTIPETAMAYVIAQSKATYLADKGGTGEALSFWSGRAAQLLRNLIIDNQRVLDEDASFRPGNVGFVVPTIQDWVTY